MVTRGALFFPAFPFAGEKEGVVPEVFFALVVFVHYEMRGIVVAAIEAEFRLLVVEVAAQIAAIRVAQGGGCFRQQGAAVLFGFEDVVEHHFVALVAQAGAVDVFHAEDIACGQGGDVGQFCRLPVDAEAYGSPAGDFNGLAQGVDPQAVELQVVEEVETVCREFELLR